MVGKSRLRALSAALVLGVAALWLFAADGAPSRKERRETALKAQQQGNWKDAYEGLRKLALDPADDPAAVGSDLTNAITCLQRLGRDDEIDDFREGVIGAHKGNWRLLDTAARTYQQQGQHYGYIIAGKFSRGWRRAGGYVSSVHRDRGRALQLMQQALPLVKDEKVYSAVALYYFHFADVILNGAGYYEAWRLQSLTDLAQLPDYGEGWGYGGTSHGAPVDANGDPVYYKVPKTYETSQNDGQRWRWMLTRAVEFEPSSVSEADMILANFMRGQVGVQTMAQYGRRFRGGDDKEDTSGTYALHTLTDDETIARLATGTKRFKVPDEFNWVKIYERGVGRGKSTSGEQARDALASEYEDRRQYVKSADAWKKAIEEYGAGQNGYRKQRLDQIVGNWGRFEPGEVQPAGAKANVDFRFRNGNKVSFEARPIDVTKLLEDVKTYLKSNPGRNVDWQKTNIGNIGYRLVEQNETGYLGEKAASWDMDLKPRPEHVDDCVTVTTPLLKPGAYLLSAKMAGGNLSRIIVWLSDTVIVRKQLEGKVLYYVADAVTGQPVPKADLDFFGWRQVQVKPNTNEYRVETAAFSDATNADGQAILGNAKLTQGYQWVVTARKAKDGQGGADRFAYLGFSWFWFGQVYDSDYNQTRVFTMTDRPVYRPLQTVQFKAWVEHSKYDQPDTSDFAGKSFTVLIHNPRGDKLYEKTLTADEYGGLTGEFPLAKDAVLGTYGIQVKDHGGGSFRVEEYKKPEFEVTVEAPKEPVQLGEPITATIQAKYYFGAPVVRAKVKYKVTRSSHSSDWHPRGTWDWLYGRGYWWFAADYAWYPGWAEWGTRRPVPSWFRGAWAPPEVVLENEVEIGPDGIVKVPIDTSIAKALHGDQDHKYTITAEVVDESRRTIVGTGDVLVARKPFRVFAWVNSGHYNAGDTIQASFRAQTLDSKPVSGAGELTLYRITYNEKNEPVEKAVQTWKLATDAQGQAREQMKADQPGQYRLSYQVTDAKKHTEEGGYLFVVTGAGFDGKDYRFNDVELVADKREYAPGDKVKLLVNTNRADSAVLLFVRPANGVYLAPKVLRLKGKSTLEEIAVIQKDMPNFFVEALTVHGGKVYSELRELVVPPEKRVLNVEVLPSATEYRPGQKATVKVKLTDLAGKPFAGSTVLTVYDRSVEYVSGGSNVPEIKAFFWSWRRQHYPSSETNVAQWFQNLLRHNEVGMANLGVFGAGVVEELAANKLKSETKRERGEDEGRDGAGAPGGFGGAGGGGFGGRFLQGANEAEAPGMPAGEQQLRQGDRAEKKPANGQPDPGAGGVGPQPAIRKNFADTAYWSASIATNKDGIAEVTFPMPENLTGWKVKVWAMGHGTRVGQGEAEVVTKKDLLVRLQAPRFFVQKDEVVLSANVHNYLKTEKNVEVTLELDGGTLASLGELKQHLMIPASRDQRVDWRVAVKSEGQAVVRVKAITDEDADAMEMRFPCLVHGMLKTDSYSGYVRPDKDSYGVSLTVPAERRVNESRLEVRYSPTLAGAMVDALPYLVDYPYGCTEQTLNRFLPTVIVQRTLQRMNLNLKDIRDKRTNLNAQEIGDDKERAKGWKRFDRNPVFDEAEVKSMSAAGVLALSGMQLSDGGWGWFSGYGEHSWPHTTAVVVHGLQLAKENDVGLPLNMLERGVAWLKNYQAEQIRLIKNAPSKTVPFKEHADEVDALVDMVLVDAGTTNDEMRDFLYRDRNELAVYAKAMFGLALHKRNEGEKLAMILRNIDQFVVQDDENQTAYLRLPAGNHWWQWYGSETEANGYYLKLLARTSPKDEKASRLVKYLLNNRKNATYWNSTRDTAICVEAMADYLKASGEDLPNMDVEVWLDGKKVKEEHIDAKNLFTFDNKLVLTGDAIETGKHLLEVRRKGTGPVYFNAYLTNFTLEDFITKAGLEVKVNRKYYKLTRADKDEKVQGSSGQVVGQRAEKYVRTELKNLSVVKSGDLVEVELEIDSKNDYEYLIFEDPKAAGFEALLVRSGYNGNDMGAYVELRDDRVSFFVRALARGKHSVSYRLRAEIPGKFSALPTRGYAMYAPELKGNSDEIKIGIDD